MSKLIVIEAPGKVKSFKKYVPAYTTIASYGHTIDLEKKSLSVDIKDNFKPLFVVMDDKKDILAEILRLSKKADDVYIMSDLDTEGCGLGYNIYTHLVENGVPDKIIKRAKTNAITKSDIEEAIENAEDMNSDINIVMAYQTRRILDRLAGYKTSFLVKLATGGTSAGRVQSAALRILSEREREINAFVPLEYWPVELELLTKEKDKIIVYIKKPDQKDINNSKQANEIVNKCKKSKAKVLSYEEKINKIRAYAPFTTSTLYQSAAANFKWKTSKTASVAQSLYTSGKISYYRTDSTHIVPNFVNEIRCLITSSYGNQYLPEKYNHFSVKKTAQEAHEACRVIDLKLTETDGTADEQKLYKMIWKRTVSCQMTDMEKLSVSADFDVEGYVFGANGSKIIFDGFRKVWDYGPIVDTELPKLKIGDELDVIDVKTEQKFTEPPPRYSEQTFVKKLETEAIGRPSTYASIVKTLEDRKYITSTKSINVTPLGLKVNDFLVNVNFCFADIKFTAEMEEKLDLIAEGKITKDCVLKEFWEKLQEDIKRSKDIKKEKVVTKYMCPKCKELGKDTPLILRDGRFGKFLSCDLYNKSKKNPGCDYKINVAEDGSPKEKVEKQVNFSDKNCPKCGNPLVIRNGKYGPFLGCTKWATTCPGIYDLEGKEIISKKKPFKTFKKWKKK